jgi:hypothetical protein
VAASLLGAGLAPASAQWFGGFGGFEEAPIPPAAITRSLMRRGFVEIGRPRFDGAVYVVEGVNARGMRLRLVIDAFDGGLISHTRLDAPLLPPADVGRERSARNDPFRDEFGPGLADEPLPRGPGRERIDRSELPPLPALDPRRDSRVEPQRRREATKPDTPARQPAALPGKAKAATEPQAVPAAPAPVEAAKPAPATATAAAPPPAAKASEPPQPVAPQAPAPAVETPAPAKSVAAPSEPEAVKETPTQPAPQRSVRIIEGVAPLVPQPSEAARPEEKKPDIAPPVTLE